MRLAMLVAVSALAFAPAAFAGTTGNGWTNGAASTLPDPNEHKRSTAVIPPIYKIDARGEVPRTPRPFRACEQVLDRKALRASELDRRPQLPQDPFS